MDFFEAVDRLEYDKSQPVSFKYMDSMGEIIHNDIPSVNTVENEEMIIPPDELIPFMP